MKERNIKILEYQGDGGLPKGKNLFLFMFKLSYNYPFYEIWFMPLW